MSISIAQQLEKNAMSKHFDRWDVKDGMFFLSIADERWNNAFVMWTKQTFFYVSLIALNSWQIDNYNIIQRLPGI